MDNREYTAMTLLDLSKAFDTLAHDLLLNKLSSYGIANKDLNLLKGYLSDRAQRVKVNNEFSDMLVVNRGVPQGSILGPFLFILFMNDFPAHMQTPPIMYADDITLLSSHRDLNTLNTRLNIQYQKSANWLKENQLILNQGKTVNITFSLSKTNTCMQKSAKLLGLYLDSNMSWNTHIDYLITILSRNLYLLRRLKNSLSLKFLCVAYHAFFHTHIGYSVLFWGGAARMNEIFRLQKRAVRILVGLSFTESCRGHFKSLKILTVPSHYIFSALLYIKCHISEFDRGTDIHNYNTRNKNSLLRPNVRLAKRNNAFQSIGIKFFNMLPPTLQLTSLAKFKKETKLLLISIEGYSFVEIENYLHGVL
jgi:hypothetical protein